MDSLFQSLQCFSGRFTGNLNLIAAFDLIPRVCQPVGEFAVIRGQQQPRAVFVQPTDSEQPRTIRKKVEHPRSSLWITLSAEVAGRLVHQKIMLWFTTNPLAVNPHDLRSGIDDDA